MFRELTYTLYNSILYPKTSIVENSNENIKQSFLIFILSNISVSVSFMYTLRGQVMPFMVLYTSIAFTLYFGIVSIVNMMMINTTALFVSDRKQKISTRAFFTNMFNASAVYILTMPLSILFSFLGTEAHSSLMYLFYFLISMYYFLIIIKIVRNNFEIKNKVSAFLIALSPAIISFLHFFAFFIFYFYMLTSVIIG